MRSRAPLYLSSRRRRPRSRAAHRARALRGTRAWPPRSRSTGWLGLGDVLAHQRRYVSSMGALREVAGIGDAMHRAPRNRPFEVCRPRVEARVALSHDHEQRWLQLRSTVDDLAALLMRKSRRRG